MYILCICICIYIYHVHVSLCIYLWVDVFDIYYCLIYRLMLKFSFIYYYISMSHCIPIFRLILHIINIIQNKVI